MKKSILISSIVCFTLLWRGLGVEVFAQDIHFSQFYMSPLTQNPAMVGAVYDMQALINYKDQWKSIGTGYKTVAASFDMKFQRKKVAKGFLAGGINLFNDKAGDAKMGITQVNLNVGYHFQITDFNTIGAGVQAGFVQRSVNYAALQWGNQFDGTSYNSTIAPTETTGSSSFSYADMGAGVLWTYNNTKGALAVTDNHDLKINLGFSMFHISQPKYSFMSTDEKLYLKMVIHGNALVSIPKTNIAFVPGFMYYNQGKMKELFLGTLIRYKLKQDSKYTTINKGAAISIGGFLRAKDAIALALQLEYSNYTIGMSYDVNTSKLKTASTSKGGFEISIRFVTPNPFVSTSKARF